MIVLHFKFPNTSHPLHDTPYMKHVSSDRFGLYIQAADPKFNEQAVRELFRKLGAVEIDAAMFDEPYEGARPPIFEGKFIALLGLTVVAVAGIVYFAFNVLLQVEPFTWMADQPKLKAQKPSALFANGIGMRAPVEGTVARGFIPYPYHGKPEEAAKNLVNPLLPTSRVLERGKARYLTFCSPCHGNFGNGDSRLRGQFPNPPTLHSDKVRTWPDGSLYHVITDGQNVMPPYASQISRDDRWAIVHYIRVLERAQNPKESDLK
jgi:mono/diheme cytochrome c family protein